MLSIACTDRYWSIATVILNDNLHLVDGNLWIHWCLCSSRCIWCPHWNQSVARLRCREHWSDGLSSCQGLRGDDLLRKYLWLRWCHARLLLYHEHSRWLHHLVILWLSGFASFAWRWSFIIIDIGIVGCRDPMRASSCAAPRTLFMCLWCLWTSLVAILRLLLAVTIIGFGSQTLNSLLRYGTLRCRLLIFLRLP